MSIFRDSFHPSIQDQIATRQTAINNRTPQNLTYYNSRNAWIRLSSSVNVYNGKGSPTDAGSYTSDLAKQYILQGGLLNGGNARAGIGDFSNAYSNVGSDGNTYRLGIRPMPGITSVEVKSLGAYGSLREATVNFQCWDIKQLEDLELLYMRPGYSVLLEWGWSPYLNNKGDLVTTVDYTDIIDTKWVKEDLYAQQYARATDGNYIDVNGTKRTVTGFQGNVDSMYGTIKNYSWKARMDGGYDCQATIISLGEVIESLKINYAPLDNLSSIVNSKGLISENIISEDNTLFTISRDSLSKSYSNNILAGIYTELYKIGLRVAEKYESEIKEGKPYILKDKKYGCDYDLFIKDIQTNSNNKSTKSEQVRTVGNGSLQVYITLESLTNLFNNYVLLRDGKAKTPFTSISVFEKGAINPDSKSGLGYLLSLAHPLELSVDPTVCLIKNKFWKDAKFIPSINNAVDPTKGNQAVPGGNNITQQQLDEESKKLVETTNDFNNAIENIKFLDKIKKPYFIDDNWQTELGIIGNIYVNITMLYDLCINDQLAAQDKKEKNDIALYDYIKNVLSKISTAIGEVNNFDLFVDENIARIIDINYVDRNASNAYNDAFILEMHNLDSVVRSYSLESKIFQDQATQVAIGAQVGGAALGVDATTLVDFNRNIIDRIIPIKDAPTTNTNNDLNANLISLNTSLQTLTEYFNKLSYGFFTEANFDVDSASSYSNSLKDIINFYKNLSNSKIKNKSIIPTSLSIEMDGIGGIIIGNLFRIPDEILPKGYKGGNFGSKLGYIVTRIGHSLQNNDWVTRLEAQMVILDDPKGLDTTFTNLKFYITPEGEVSVPIELGGKAPITSKTTDNFGKITSIPNYAAAALDMIATTEGTATHGQNGYDIIVGYKIISNWNTNYTGTHPNIYVKSVDSTAAGRYQFLYNTWNEIAGRSTPFNKDNQDKAAYKLMQRKAKGGDNTLKQAFDIAAKGEKNVLKNEPFLNMLGTDKNNFAGTWASLPDRTGRYQYNKQGNKSLRIQDIYNIYLKAVEKYIKTSIIPNFLEAKRFQ